MLITGLRMVFLQGVAYLAPSQFAMCYGGRFITYAVIVLHHDIVSSRFKCPLQCYLLQDLYDLAWVHKHVLPCNRAN